MGCILAFIQGRIEGGGIDNNGAFAIRGSYENDGTFSWVKTYTDVDSKVVYQGAIQDDTLSGRWLLPSCQGTFQLRPLT